jgi:Flp pilus assembly protein TadD
VLEDINEPSARAEAQTALRLQPISTDALLVLARLDLKTNQAQSAEEIVDRVLALEPDNSAALALKRTISDKLGTR